MINMEDWIRRQRQLFEVGVELLSADSNQFLRRTWLLSDPHDRGLPFRVAENSEGETSWLSVDELFSFSRLNVAEGFESEFIQSIAGTILTGDLAILRSPIGIPCLAYVDKKGLWARGTVSTFGYVIHRNRFEDRLRAAQDGFVSNQIVD